MGLTNKKEEQLRQMPLINTRITKSKDGRFLIHKTEIVNIRPVAYYEAVLSDKEPMKSDADKQIDALTA